MENNNEALREMNRITADACAGKMTEEQCRAALENFKDKYGDGLIIKNRLGDIKNQPASEEKLRKLRLIQAQGGTSEETFVEMAKTGRALRKRKIAQIITAIGIAVAVVVLVISLLSALKK